MINMSNYVSDSMAFIPRLEKRKIPRNVKEKFVQAEKGEIEISIPVMVFADQVDSKLKDWLREVYQQAN